MPGSVDVVDVRIAREWQSEPNLKDGSRQTWVDLVVRVRNSAPDAQFVIGEMRGIEFDDATKTLKLRLRDQPGAAEPNAPLTRLTLPTTKLVQPGEEVDLVISTPAVQHRLVPGPGLGMANSPFDLRDVVTLDIEVAHAKQAPTVATSAQEAVWGEVSAATRPMMLRRPPND